MKNFWLKLNKPILALAPMAGITDSAFRQICKENGADVTYSEMASATALFYNPKATLDLIKFGADERPYIVQLFGKEPAHFAAAAKILNSLPLEKGDAPKPAGRQAGAEGFEEQDKLFKSPSVPLFQRGKLCQPDGIDINFGCPAKKVFGHGSGCAIMPQKKLARDIIKAVCDNTNLPVSIKIRAGAKGMDALDFVKNTADLPYSAIMIHGRTYEGGFSGTVNFEICEEIKKMVPDKIVLGNGGINTPQEAIEILEKYPLLDGLGIARGAWGRPWIFQEIKNLFQNHSPSPLSAKISRKIPADISPQAGAKDFEMIKQIMIHHAKLIHKNKGKKGLFEIRKHMAWYVKGFPGAAELRRKLVMAESVEEIKEILKCA